MAAKVAVVVPHHKEELNIFEQISLAQVQKVLGKYPIIFAVPEGTNFSWIPAGRQVIHLPYLGRGVKYYNILLTSSIFYEPFLAYDYILIYHLDAFVFFDKLEYFCNLGYDNIGAPWPWDFCNSIKKIRGYKNFPRVGNGGFCLRNVKACYKLIKENAYYVNKYLGVSEDDFWAYMGVLEDSGFRSAPIKIANAFSVEYLPERCVKRNGGELPFGCHGWYRFNADSYAKIFMSAGYDLYPLKNQMQSDYLIGLSNRLSNIALLRLSRRLNLGQSLVRYLPQKNFASIRVVRHPFTVLLLVRLLLENPGLSDKIFFYDETELDILTHDCRPEKLPHLLLAMGGIENLLIESFKNNGIAYGNRVVSFQREYLSYCEKLFHNLGK